MKDVDVWDRLWKKIQHYREEYHYEAHLGKLILELKEVGWTDVNQQPVALMQFSVLEFNVTELSWIYIYAHTNMVRFNDAKEVAQNWYYENIYADHILLNK